MDLNQYLDIFIDETKEHLQSLNEHILILEQEPDNQNTINEIFRAAHSLKGMAGTMGYTRMQRLTHDMENVFSEIRNGKMKVSSKLVDVLFRGLDALEEYLDNIQAEANEGTNDNNDIIKELNDILNAGLGNVVEEPKDVQAQAVQSSNDSKTSEDIKKKFLDLKIEDYEQGVFDKAIADGFKIVGLTIYLNENCVLKGARVFMINRSLEEMGDIVKLHPNAQDLEDEKFDFDYSAIVITKETPDKIKEAVKTVSEVKEVIADYINPKEMKHTEDKSPTGDGKANNAASDDNKAKSAKTQATRTKHVANRSVRVDIDKLDVLMNQVSELIIAKNGLLNIAHGENDSIENRELKEQLEYLERITTNLHESVMKTRMVPIESVVNRFPRMIRDISKKLDKKMELYMTGEDTELDRTVIDEIGDPLMHLLRNAADHGLESNEEREKAGKNPVGSIYLNAYQEGNSVVIEVTDDGYGIDTEKIKKKAIDKGTVTAEQAAVMSQKELVNLLFAPSFSTAEKVTDISGRGVGLDVVKTKIEALGGEIEARTKLGEGSSFIVRLPLTLAIIQALMVEIGDEKYALPLGNIQTVEILETSNIKLIQDKEVINLRGEVIPIVRLNTLLDCKKVDENQDELTVVIVQKGERKAGMVVDKMLGQLEIVIKPIGKYINLHKIISGATILGNGDVALILDVNTLI